MAFMNIFNYYFYNKLFLFFIWIGIWIGTFLFIHKRKLSLIIIKELIIERILLMSCKIKILNPEIFILL